MSSGLARDLVRTQDQLGPSDTENLVFKLINEQIPNIYGTVKGIQQNIGHALVLGHTTNGRLGTYNGVDGQQIILGTGGLGSITISRIVSFNNTFVETLRDDEYVDTDNTNAVVDTGTYRIDF